MTRAIADILELDRVQFNHLIQDWEHRSGSNSHDVRLYSDVRGRAVKAIEGLGLDPSDTISGELYFALQERARSDNDWLSTYMHISAVDSPDIVLDKLIAWIQKFAKDMEVWVCKPNIARQFLKKQPPKTVMKTLGLRSVDSMLKRNTVAEILTLAFELETPEWVKKYKTNYKKCNTTDFDVKEISFAVVSKARSEKIAKAGYPISRFVSPNYELGSLMIIPPKFRFPLDVLAVTISLSEAIADMRRHSSLFRALSVRKDFGTQFYEVSSRGISDASLAISDIGWNSLHRHLVGNEYFMSKIEQPHLTKDDLAAYSALDVLEEHDERFRYWKDLEYVVYHGSGQHPVSLNLVDVVVNASNRTPYHKGSLEYGKMRLWEELWARYLQSDSVAEEVIDSYLKTEN